MSKIEPYGDVPCIHVGGTNGKGSTVAIIDSLLRAMGRKVGRFTGPHLLRWNERFHVDGLPISDEDFALHSTSLKELSEKFGEGYPDYGALTWFEFLTAIAFWHFYGCRVDMAVLEVGLGGRFDATNIVTSPLVTVITNVSLDHTHLLGDTVEKIAFEKAGIIKEGIPVVTACDGAALEEVLRTAKEKNAPVYVVDSKSNITLFENGEKKASNAATALLQLLVDNLSLLGNHQLSNGMLALIAIAVAFNAPRVLSPAEVISTIANFDPEEVGKGLKKVKWPGRLQYLEESDLFLDGAHNPGGAEALRASLEILYPDKRPLFVMSCFESKDVKKLLKCLVRKGERVFVAQAQGKRSSHSTESIVAYLEELGANGKRFATIANAVDAAREKRKKDEFIVVTGSFAAVKETMQHLSFASVEDSYQKNLKV
ncbi:MAG: bifunctional folylpolyglutamate synthase/dihydrofolate synthase [Leptolyngbya sp.]|nr:bifunctional folylpolyglutamate synthase/dihydrofolate synthase [Candidatus Melainabacteria bacterium]